MRRLVAYLPILLLLLLSSLLACLTARGADSASTGNPPIDFARQIRPILSDKCFLCHGPDRDVREADLRLDERSSALEDRGGYATIVPGDPQASELVARIFSDDPSLVMPPPDSQKALTSAEKELLRQWIAEGGNYTQHWAFVPPQRPDLPAVSADQQDRVRNPIDRFVLAELARRDLRPAGEADRVTLMRRLYLDLTGLPPTLDEIRHYLDDNPDAAYDNLVKRLLASPHYGERWGRHWLDAGRYADSDGYEKDMQRTMWFWRDWVINAFNQDKPYDDFIIEQIAGDLLPDAGAADRIATGYLRNSMVNEEGGADPEQFRVEGLFDRMDAIGKGILGITTQCAQCHSHKYDPLTHAEYYGMFAFLNNCEEASIVAYTRQEQNECDRIATEVARLKDNLKRSLPDWEQQLRQWARLAQGGQPAWHTLYPDTLPFEGQKFRVDPDGSILSESYAPPQCQPEFEFPTDVVGITGLRLELLMNPQLPAGGPGRSLHGTGALTELEVYVQPPDRSLPRRKVSLVRATSDVNPAPRSLPAPFLKAGEEDARTTGPVEYAIDGDGQTAWTTDSGPATRNQPRKAVFVLAEPIDLPAGCRLILKLNQSHGGANGNQKENYLLGCYRFSVTSARDPQADPLPAAVRELIESRPVEDWTPDEVALAFDYWRTTVGDWAEANQQIAELLADWPAGHVQLVIEARTQPRHTHRLERGNFLSPAEEVSPGTPAFLHPFPEDAPRNRLGFARWLVDRRSPTTARAIVNRVWQEYFGTGLVETPEDLGYQSPPASHPELLDWLAVEFMDAGWSFKHLHRLIVNSATYRQSSRLSAELAKADPRNRLLARGPRFRVDAEVVRDIALASSGLLNRQVGGRSVYPPAPEFLFRPPASYGDKNWHLDKDAQQYRRSLYVHAYRSVPYPPLQVFDAPNGDAACVRRVRSNTPLQALTLLNESQFVECSRELARRVLGESSGDQQDDLTHAFQLCVSRSPRPDEIEILTQLLEKSRRYFESRPEAADAAIGSQQPPSVDNSTARELAAWTIVSRAILNLDETITKQ
jgi:hypothetical protein